MKPTHIVLSDQGIGCIEAPNMLNSVIDHNWEIRYQQALEAAMKQVVLFNDQNVWCWAIPDKMPVKGKLYPVPENYRIEIKYEGVEPINGPFGTFMFGGKAYAVLVPKQKDIEPEFKDSLEKNFDRLVDGLTKQGPDKTISQTYSEEVFKKQPTSIEEAADNANGYSVYAKDKAVIFKEGFIAGARHQEDVAIKFANWIMASHYKIASVGGSLWWEDKNEKEYSTERLFEIFKQEKK